MKKKDDLLLENLYQESILGRLKGQGSGIKAGAGTILKNIGGRLTGDKTPKQSAGKEYAKAQQTSLLQTFKKKVDKEIQDFNNDLKSFKVNPDPVQLEKDFPIIAQRLKEIDKLKSFLDNPSAFNTTQGSKTKVDNEISPDFEVLPPEGSDKQQALPSSGEKLALPANNRMGLPAPEEKDASKSNEEFLAARGEVTPTQEQPTQEQPTQEQPTQEQPIKPIQPFKYTNGKTYGRDEQGWYQYLPKAKFKKQRISQKSAQVLDAYLKEEEPSGSAKQAQRATEAGFRLPVERTAARMESHNAFADFLKGYELI